MNQYDSILEKVSDLSRLESDLDISNSKLNSLKTQTNGIDKLETEDKTH